MIFLSIGFKKKTGKYIVQKGDLLCYVSRGKLNKEREIIDTFYHQFDSYLLVRNGLLLLNQKFFMHTGDFICENVHFMPILLRHANIFQIIK